VRRELLKTKGKAEGRKIRSLYCIAAFASP